MTTKYMSEEHQRVAKHWEESRKQFPSPQPILEPYDDYDPED